MPQPYPGQQWKHGWIPLTPGAIRSKNHGRTPGPKSKLGRQLANLTSSSGSGSGGRSRTGTTASPSAQMDAAIRAKAAQRQARSGATNRRRPDATRTALRSEQHNPFGPKTIARDADNLKERQSVRMNGRWVQITGFQRRDRQDGVLLMEPGSLPRWEPLDRVKEAVREHNRTVNAAKQTRKTVSFGVEPPGGWTKADEVPEGQRRLKIPQPKIEYEKNKRWGIGKHGSRWIVQDRLSGRRYSYPTKRLAEYERDQLEKREPLGYGPIEDLGDGWGLRRERSGWQLYRHGNTLGDYGLYTSREAAMRHIRGENMADKRVYASVYERRDARNQRKR